MKSSSVTIQMKATEEYFPMVSFTLIYKVVLSLYGDEILKRSYSNESS